MIKKKKGKMTDERRQEDFVSFSASFDHKVWKKWRTKCATWDLRWVKNLSGEWRELPWISPSHQISSVSSFDSSLKWKRQCTNKIYLLSHLILILIGQQWSIYCLLKTFGIYCRAEVKMKKCILISWLKWYAFEFRTI